MTGTPSFKRARGGVLLIVALGGMLLGVPTSQAAGPAGGSPRPAAPAYAYTLYGDSANSGTGSTSFSTSYAGPSGSAWSFTSASPLNLYAWTNSSNGKAIWGQGYYIGVMGDSWALGGYGGVFTGTSGVGVAATGQTTGVKATAAGYGVSATGDLIGVMATGPTGVSGWATSATGYGVNGGSSDGTGVNGTSGTGYGVYGVSNSSAGVYGTSPGNTGIGVSGFSTNYYGVQGKSTNNTGVRAVSTSGYGAHITTSTGWAALRVKNSTVDSTHFAIIAEGNVTVTGTLHATGGVSAPVMTTQGTRLVYADQSTTNVLGDQGTAWLKDGRAVITIDPLYAQTVSLGAGYQVFLTPRSFETRGLAVGNLTATSFEVREIGGGKGAYAFDWRIAAPRKGYEQARLAPAPPVPAAPRAEPELPTPAHP